MSSSNEKESILVTDDIAATCRILKRRLESKGYRVFTALSVYDALALLEANHIDLVITDYRMPKVDGLDLVRYIRENFKEIEVIMITGYPSIEGAVKAINTGAREYLAKPFTDKELFSAVTRALDKLRILKLGNYSTLQTPHTPHGLIAESKTMKNIFSAITKAASTSETVLISGESGTGKELVARAIHYNNPRSSSASFVPINCGGIPESLLESELFGYVKGAFTGAAESRAGFFQTAEGGTIFLDEISETSLTMQVKLLRVLQDKEVYMIGSSRGRKINVRIIASTNKDLQLMIKKGLFREDLYFRLNVITIDLPPLRERGNDIILLVHYFTSKFTKENDRKPFEFTDKALEALKSYHWPGNVRELENVVKRLVVMTEGNVIDVTDLPSLMRFSVPRKPDLTRTLAEAESDYIQNVLASVGGNKTRAAKILDIARATLRDKIKTIDKTSDTDTA